MADIIKKQKESLVQTIKEAEQSEMSRMKRLAQVTTSGEKSMLLRRYEKERQHDQEKIENLTKDFFVLQEKLNSGDLAQLKEQRSTTSRTHDAHQLEGARKNRFVGLETHNDVTFHAAVCEKFDKYDHKFQEKATRPVFDAHKEIHKLKLLSDKRTLLKQLVCLHVAEAGGAGSYTSRDQSRGYTGRTGSSYSGYARSESGYSRDSDRVSHATFATSGSHRASEIGRQNRIKHNIPKLGIPVPEY